MNTLQHAKYQADSLHDYALNYRPLFRDIRVFNTFESLLTGILGSGSGCIQRIAASIPGAADNSERRLRRLVHDENKRVSFSPDNLSQTLTREGAQFLHDADSVEVIVDGSDLRKPQSQNLPYLDHVRDLQGQLINGYRTLEAIGRASDGRQAILFQQTYSTQTPNFISEKRILKDALFAIVRELRAAGVQKITFIMDRGFDDLKVFRWLGAELHVKFVIRGMHFDRSTQRTPTAEPQALVKLMDSFPVLGRFTMKRPVKDKRGKVSWRPTLVEVRAGEIWLDHGKLPMNAVRLAFPSCPRDDREGWLLLTNLPVDTLEAAGAVVRLYLSRWSIEDVFEWTKQALGWEEVRLLDFPAFQRLVTCIWIAAAFVFRLGAAKETPEVKLLASLGGYMFHTGRPPGKKILLRGLRRLVDEEMVRLYHRHHPNAPTPQQTLNSLLGTLHK
ncbi:transposase [Deinococcus sp.]|uniref:transposase n=1 Tax=Deinococcus sp. TaxID=47478 RepID=UPI0025B84C18|nr:transposase [Deinococcus sp.]